MCYLLNILFVFSGLFIDISNNCSVLDHPNICFVYEYVGSKDSDREQSQYVSNQVLVVIAKNLSVQI